MSTPVQTTVAAFLREGREAILERWYRSMKDRPDRRALSRDQLLNHIPDLLEDIAATDERRAVDPDIRLATASAEAHALQRLAEGFDVDQVVVELAALRDCIFDAWVDTGRPLTSPDVRFLNRSMDRAVTAAVRHHAQARDRTLVALDRVAAATVACRDLDDLLHALLHVLVETMPAVDASAVLLREGDNLAVRATAGGYDRALHGRRVLPTGRGLASRVAAGGHALRSTTPGDALQPAPDEAAAPRTLYGLPLVQNRIVIGVVEVRSQPGSAFSEADARLFEALGARASASILQHMLYETATHRAAELDAVLKSVPDAIVVASQGWIALMNPAARELLGVDGSRFPEPYRWLDLLRPRQDAGAEALPSESWPPVLAERTGRTQVADLVLRHGASGRDVTVRMLAAPVRQPGTSGTVVVVCTDITDRRRIEAEREKLLAALQESLKDREHVLAVVAHDLRSPLTTLGLAAHALATAGPDCDVGRRAVQTVERSTRRMDRLIQDLLDANSIRAGRLALTLRTQSPAPVMTEVAESFGAAAQAKGLELRVQLGEALPLVRVDHERLVQALSNVVGNAIKVCPAGHVGLSLECRAREVVFTVTDTGPGIDAKLRDVIFEPFRRGHNGYRGTGLGLAIARGIVEGHGGRIWLESAPGQGATFRIALPAALAPAIPAPAGSAEGRL